MDGVMKAKDEGLFKHLGITGHPNVALMNRWIDDDLFDVMTVPFNAFDISRLESIERAVAKGIAVIAMNPLAGGMLGGNSEVFEELFVKLDAGVKTPTEFSLKFVEAFGTSALAGFTDAAQVKMDADILSTPKWSREKAMEIREAIMTALGDTSEFCTGCGYCKPCPQDINVPDVLRMRNYYRVLKLDSAKEGLQGRHNWDNGFKPENCTECGVCESRCPNQLPVTKLLKDARCIIEG